VTLRYGPRFFPVNLQSKPVLKSWVYFPEQPFIAHCKKMRGLAKSIVVFPLYEKLKDSNER